MIYTKIDFWKNRILGTTICKKSVKIINVSSNNVVYFVPSKHDNMTSRIISLKQQYKNRILYIYYYGKIKQIWRFFKIYDIVRWVCLQGRKINANCCDEELNVTDFDKLDLMITVNNLQAGCWNSKR